LFQIQKNVPLSRRGAVGRLTQALPTPNATYASYAPNPCRIKGKMLNPNAVSPSAIALAHQTAQARKVS
jgi:hypothetical protein